MAWRGWGDALRRPSRALTDIALTEKLLISRLSVTAKIHRLSHGGVSSTGQGAAFPNPVGHMEAVPPRFPADATIIRARRGAAGSAAKKGNRLYAVRRKKVMDAPLLPKEHNPYCADVVLDPPG